MSTVADLEQRLRALEDINAIRELKARYLRACDRKQPDTMRDCFIEKGAVIEADGFSSFNDREGWVKVFTELAVNNPNVMDTHHGQNPHIVLIGPDSASAVWDLQFTQINLKEQRWSTSPASTATNACAAAAAGGSARRNSVRPRS